MRQLNPLKTNKNEWGSLWKGEGKGNLSGGSNTGGSENLISIKLSPSIRNLSVSLKSLE